MPARTGRRALFQPKRWRATLAAPPAWAGSAGPSGHEKLIRAGRPAMACRFEILFPASQRSKIEAVHEALDEIQRLESQMSVYRRDSEISVINQQAAKQPVPVEKRLFKLLQQGVDVYRKTGGAFDMTSTPLSRCWGFFMRQGRIPTQEEIALALDATGTQFLDLDSAGRSVFFRHRDLELNLASIGKGYALDRAGALLTKAGFERALLHAGHSTLLALGTADGGHPEAGWPVSLRHPLQKDRDYAVLGLRGRALSTSGAGEQFFVADGRKYGHVIDPRTGYAAHSNLNATALAPSGAQADALSTAFFVMQLQEVETYCRSHPEVGALIIPEPGGEAPLQCFTYGSIPADLEVRL